MSSRQRILPAERYVQHTPAQNGLKDYLPIEDKTQLSAQFYELYAEAGPGIALAMNRRVCRTSFQYDLPPAFTFFITSVDYVRNEDSASQALSMVLTDAQQAHYKLDPEVTAYQSSMHYCTPLSLRASVAR